MKRYKIGLYEKAMPSDMSWEEKMKCARECGYDYIEMCIDATEEKIQRVYMEEMAVQELVCMMHETKMPIQSMSISALTKYALGDENNVIRARGEEILSRAIDLAARLGIRTVMVPGYDIYYGHSSPKTKRLFLENVKKMAERASMQGILIGFETMENEFMNTVEKALHYVDLIDSPYLKVYPDIGNLTNAAVLYKQSVAEDIEQGKGKIISFHLKETLPGQFREVPFGTGHVDFAKAIKTAWSIGVRRYVTELWCTDDEWKENIQVAYNMMKGILEKQKAVF